jgi:hypothetical protein
MEEDIRKLQRLNFVRRMASTASSMNHGAGTASQFAMLSTIQIPVACGMTSHQSKRL